MHTSDQVAIFHTPGPENWVNNLAVLACLVFDDADLEISGACVRVLKNTPKEVRIYLHI